MSIEYDALLERHGVNVKTGYSFESAINELIEDGKMTL